MEHVVIADAYARCISKNREATYAALVGRGRRYFSLKLVSDTLGSTVRMQAGHTSELTSDTIALMAAVLHLVAELEL